MFSVKSILDFMLQSNFIMSKLKGQMFLLRNSCVVELSALI
jgi:hypothetical protein